MRQVGPSLVHDHHLILPPSLLLSFPSSLSALAASGRTELSPVCAVIGGILGQEILKAVSHKGEPALNCFLWDGETHEGRVIQVPPPGVKR